MKNMSFTTSQRRNIYPDKGRQKFISRVTEEFFAPENNQKKNSRVSLVEPAETVLYPAEVVLDEDDFQRSEMSPYSPTSVESCDSIGSVDHIESTMCFLGADSPFQDEAEEVEDDQAIHILEVTACRGLGLGVKVTQPVQKYHVVLSEKPLLTFSVHENIEEIVNNKLSCEDRAEFYSLYDSTASGEESTSVQGCETLRKSSVGVCLTNAIALGGGQQAILRVGSRINHSCAPNVGYRFDGENVQFYALRNIEFGEELFVSYIDHVQPREVRQKLLEKRYGFVCSCIVCQLEGEDLAKSEARRQHLCDLDCQILKAIKSQQHEQALAYVEHQMNVLQEEECLATPMKLLRSEYDALCTCQELENIGGMRKWIQLAIDHACIAHGKESKIYASLCAKVSGIRVLEALAGFPAASSYAL